MDKSDYGSRVKDGLGKTSLNREIVDYMPGNAAFGGQRGKGVIWKPGGVFQLVYVNDNFPSGVIGHKSGHELGWKRPVLAPHVSDIADFNACFFPDFAYCTFFQ